MLYYREAISVIMGGGRGTRLFPLTKYRAKPAVPIGGKHRLIDIPISNSINGGINKIFVLTQYNSESLNRHIIQSYTFDVFSGGFVEVLAASQTLDSEQWYQGTADAVRQNFPHYQKTNPQYIVILSGDQLYQMRLNEFLDQHRHSGADITIAAKVVNREQAQSFGLLKIDENQRIVDFVEKPKDPAVLDAYRIDPTKNEAEDPLNYLASMGIYIFNRDVLEKALSDTTQTDFGKEVIPSAIKRFNVKVYQYYGYWEDIGTIRSFYEENIALTDPIPRFNFYDPDFPIYTHSRFLPPAKIDCQHIHHSLISDGVIINAQRIERSLIGIRSVIGEGTVIKNSFLMGNDFYDFTNPHRRPQIGKNCHIEGAIIDKNVRIEDNVVIRNKEGLKDYDGDNIWIRDGIVIVGKGAHLPSGFEI